MASAAAAVYQYALLSSSSLISKPISPAPFFSKPGARFVAPLIGRRKLTAVVVRSSYSGEAEASSSASETEEEEWLKRLPDKNKALYSHSLPCIEAWLRQLGFRQSKEDRAVWLIEKADWHAQLSLDITDLYIRYLKSGPGDLDKDVDRRFSYALSRDDIENAILGGP